jgi:hypothetical protein
MAKTSGPVTIGAPGAGQGTFGGLLRSNSHVNQSFTLTYSFTPPDPKSESKPNIGIIVGASVGGVVVVGAIIAVVIVMVQRKKGGSGDGLNANDG